MQKRCFIVVELYKSKPKIELKRKSNIITNEIWELRKKLIN